MGFVLNHYQKQDFQFFFLENTQSRCNIFFFLKGCNIQINYKSKFVLKFFSENSKACLIASIFEDLSFENFSGLGMQRSTFFLTRFKIFLEFELTILEMALIFLLEKIV